eukprot:GABV01008855.1.p1 GENE.GABV01008855.1~~GABV01008855.1.p1  ORF type:complete len:218 (+),score=54.46 GABV01008855.1:307-960(+)
MGQKPTLMSNSNCSFSIPGERFCETRRNFTLSRCHAPSRRILERAIRKATLRNALARRIWEPILKHQPHPRLLPSQESLQLLFERIPRSRNSDFPQDFQSTLDNFAQNLGCHQDGKSMLASRFMDIAELGSRDVFQTQNSLRTVIHLLSRMTGKPVQDHFDEIFPPTLLATLVSRLVTAIHHRTTTNPDASLSFSIFQLRNLRHVSPAQKTFSILAF